MAVRFQAPPQPARTPLNASLRQLSLPPPRPSPGRGNLPGVRGASISLPQYRAGGGIHGDSLGMGEGGRGGLAQPRHASMPIGGFPSLGPLPPPGPAFPQLSGDLHGFGQGQQLMHRSKALARFACVLKRLASCAGQCTLP